MGHCQVLIALAIACLLPEPVSAQPAPEAPGQVAPAPEQLQRWIEQLGSQRFAEREEATVQLQRIAIQARQLLEEATRSDNAERAERAKRILGQMLPATHRVVDALHQPVPLAQARIVSPVVVAQGDAPPGAAARRRAFADAEGRLAHEELSGISPGQLVIEFEHPEYGRARCTVERALLVDPNALPFLPPGVQPPGPGNLRDIVLPLVRRGTEARQRALEGVVLDAAGEPIAGASVRAGSVRTPGEGLIDPQHPLGEAITDEQGRFSYYVPPSQQRQNERGELIPLGSRYELSITSNREDCFPLEQGFDNRQPAEIRLPRAELFHRFRFQLAEGELKEMSQLTNVWVYHLTEQGRRTRLPMEEMLRGRNLIPGRYVATYHSPQGKAVEFLPLQVDADSPETLTFVLPAPVRFAGRVVDGITGEPLPRCWVFGWSSTSDNNLAKLTEEDWRVLRDAPDVAGPDHDAVKLLRRFYGVEDLVRADQEGRFSIEMRPDRKFYGLLAFAEGRLPYHIHVSSLPLQDAQLVDNLDFPLFPAATVTVRPVFDEGVQVAVGPEWLVEPEGQPDWCARFLAARQPTRDFSIVHWLKLNESQQVFIPAGLKVRARWRTPYHDEWAPLVSDVLQAQPGESLPLGDLRFPKSLSTSVLVVDGTGQPVEGVPVRRFQDAERAWSVAHNTDAQGLARFFVEPNSTGRFRALEPTGDDQRPEVANLFARFQVDGAAPGDPYKIVLTDEQLRTFRGK